MNIQVVRNKKQMEELFDQIRQIGPPLIIATQRVRHKRSIDVNEYLWAVLYETIARATGQTAIEVHEAYKQQFGFRWEMRWDSKKKIFRIVPENSTASMDQQEIWDYIMRCRADAEIELGVIVPMPNELFTEQLIFSNE